MLKEGRERGRKELLFLKPPVGASYYASSMHVKCSNGGKLRLRKDLVMSEVTQPVAELGCKSSHAELF